MGGNGPVLEATGLRKRFGDLEAVRGVGFTIDPGETYGLLGPNGAGKTTTISMVSGLLEKDAGEVTIAGLPVTTTALEPKRLVGLVPQEVAIYPDLTARENLRFFGRLYEMTGSALAQRIDEVLAVIGLADRADDRAKDFSGGMKRRLNIGIGLLHRPALLILDEPTVGVDPQSRNAILESIEELSAEGMAVLYTTHYMEEAERLCDRVGIIDQGEIRAEGTRRQLVESIGEQDRLRIEASGPLRDVSARLGELPGVTGTSTGDGVVEILADDGGAILSPALGLLAAAGVAVSSVTIEEPDLEAVFLHLTGKALRD
ncbi:MAG: ABC transporter ATP-binding protein [Actinomycetota bacterium]|nr:ABC transporter ATP-binding protein [Actinomycetota bacterium]